MDNKQQKEMSFLDHLEVLRWHLVRSSSAIIVIASIAFVFFKDLIFNKILFAPIKTDFFTYKLLCQISKKYGAEGMCITELPFTIQSLGMAEQFSIHIWTSITVGIIISFPYILWEFWRFISPGLYKKERRNAVWFIIISSFLFFTGVLFGYYVITPLSVNFLGNYSVSDSIIKSFQVGSYISIVKSSVLAAGLMFELPVIIFFLAKLGLITPEFLRTYRKHAIVIVLIVAAAITPPDVISQVIVTIPIIFLYELSIIIAKVIYKEDLKKSGQLKKEVNIKKKK